MGVLGGKSGSQITRLSMPILLSEEQKGAASACCSSLMKKMLSRDVRLRIWKSLKSTILLNNFLLLPMTYCWIALDPELNAPSKRLKLIETKEYVNPLDIWSEMFAKCPRNLNLHDYLVFIEPRPVKHDRMTCQCLHTSF